jgi:hypothetical protein
VAPSGSEGQDEEELVAKNTAAAYNQSIYLMVGMPYLLLGAVGYLIYRGYRKGQQAPPGDSPRPDV